MNFTDADMMYQKLSKQHEKKLNTLQISAPKEFRQVNKQAGPQPFPVSSYLLFQSLG